MSTAAPAPAPAVSARPPELSAGSVIGRSFSVWFRNFVPFSIVTIVVYLPVIALAALTPLEERPAWSAADRILSGLANLVVSGALTYGVLRALRGQPVGAGTLLGTGFKKIASVFGASFRVGLYLILGTLLFVVPAIIWYCGLYVAIPAAVVEDPGSADALKRSRELTKGHRWSIFAVVLVVLLVTVLVAALAGVAVALLAPIVPAPIPTVLAAGILALVSALGACASAVAYNDLRLAKEGVATEDLVKVFE